MNYIIKLTILLMITTLNVNKAYSVEFTMLDRISVNVEYTGVIWVDVCKIQYIEITPSGIGWVYMLGSGSAAFRVYSTENLSQIRTEQRNCK